jgi:signal transduction histidine kinase
MLSEEKQQILTDQNVVLEQQVTERTAALKKSLDDLKETQSQLIHSEKMASLGALVAGIAHEIKNPLNFVNNFAEVNKELLSELNDAIQKGNISDVKSIAKNISDNQEKIDHHGKRADGIVKSMLQHSRSSAGPKEPTDINALCDEYLRLTYHGYRAKDKTFTARVETHFDPSMEKIMIVGQDMGRVVLNVINNAFYAVSEKKHKKGSDFIPEVIVSTRKLEGRIEIVIKDNGIGIPANVMGKIFQPFFTTKPPGQGTGLGLSLAYDIVKVHGGEILVQSVEGHGAEFIIRL